MDRLEILTLANKHGWTFELEKQSNPLMLSFFKPQIRINVYWTTMTVSTALDHPKKGKTQLYRKMVSATLLNRIFQNPRAHTGRGYFKKPVDHMGLQADEGCLGERDWL